MPSKIKPATTFEEQIKKLRDRGLYIENEERAYSILSRLSYYTFTGYLHDFKETEDRYINNISFDKIYNIIEFDRRLRNLILYGIETIENTFQTKLAYNFAHKYGPLGYMDKSNFRDEREHNIFMNKLRDSKINNRHMPFIKHHNKRYKGQLPIWVAAQVFTMGMLYNFYKNINTSIQKKIAKEYNTGTNQIISWMENITYLRNLVAHYMRIYNFKLQKTPVKCNKNHNTYIEISNKVFDLVHIMKFLILDKDEWNLYILEGLDSLISQYDDYIDLECIGFPVNWKEILVKN